MNASYEWLNELVPAGLTAAALGEIITARCAPVDEVVELRADLAGIVVARVVSAGRHPNADHLWVTRVDAGGTEILDVVCGAPNVREGALYPFAHVGTTLPGGITLEKRKIRGEYSNGMLCSASELGLGEDHTGILELHVSVPPGTRFLDAVPAGDHRIVVDVTPNRPDLLSHVGLARELAAATGVALRAPDDALDGWSQPVRTGAEGATAGIRVQLIDSDGCTRYIGIVIRGVKVGESPEWLKRRLEAVGSRSVNNIVDVTNYILNESGQPLHAFDLDRMGGGAVVIRRAGDAEVLTTLDSVERRLDATMTVIADAQRAHAIAGVIGGLESAVSQETRNIFLEIATFDAARTRTTRSSLGISTDASYRFERGVDPELPGRIARRAAKLILEVAGGQLADAPLDLYPEPAARRMLTLRVSRVHTVLGESVSASEISGLLRSIGFEAVLQPDSSKNDSLAVVVPSWRVDVSAEVDLIEEIARLRGYASFPEDIRPYRPGNTQRDAVHELARRLRTLLTAHGLFEARPLPFVRGDDATHVAVANPVSEDERHLRRSILETLSKLAEHNLAQMRRNVRLFEIGNVFAPAAAGNRLFEATTVAAVVLGERFPPHFTAPRPPAFDEWDAKGLAEAIAAVVHPRGMHELRPADSQRGLLWSVVVDGDKVGEVRRLSLDAPVWAAPAFGVEIRLARVNSSAVAPPGRNAHRSRERGEPAGGPVAGGSDVGVSSARGDAQRYRPIPSQPAASIDLALLVPDTVSAAQVEAIMRRTAGELLESVELFDEFRGEGLAQGTRSLAWRLTFRHSQRTLRDKEVEGRRQKLLTVLEKELGVRQRST